MASNKKHLNKIVQLFNNEEAAIANLNANVNMVNDVIDDYLSRSGKVPTQMQAPLDMGTQRIINIGDPVEDNDAVRYKDVKDALEDLKHAKGYAQDAENAAIRADASSAEAKEAARQAKEAKEDAESARDSVQGLVDDVNDLIEHHPEIQTVADNIEDVVSVADHMEDIQAAEGYAELAKDWATKMDGPVEGSDYSSKWYAHKVAEDLNLSNCNDVNITNPTEGEALIYNSTSQKWVNGEVRQTYRGYYDVTKSYKTGDIVKQSAMFYAAKQDMAAYSAHSPMPHDTADPYWAPLSEDHLVGYLDLATAEGSFGPYDYKLGCVNHGISGSSYEGYVYYYASSNAPSINSGTGILTAPLLKTTTQAQNDNSTYAATTAYVDTAKSGLQSQIDNLSARGRFLALWDCSTGLAMSNPPESPYTYHSGDYFIVGAIAAGGASNYKPTGSSYTTGVASTVVETNPVDIDDVYYYDGASWRLQTNVQKTVSFVNIAGSPYDNTSLANALNSKANTSSLQTVAFSGSYNDLSNKIVAGEGLVLTPLKNYEIVGTGVTVSDAGVATGFSSSSYITINDPIAAAYADNTFQNFEVIFKYTTPATQTMSAPIYSLVQDVDTTRDAFYLYVDDYDGALKAVVMSSAMDSITVNGPVLDPSTTYWIKCTWAKDEKAYISISTDGTTYSTPVASDDAIDDMGAPYGTGYIGAWPEGDAAEGSIDLSESTIKVNGVQKWVGFDTNQQEISATVEVDQTYDALSANAQSGVAVASAIANAQPTYNSSTKTLEF